MANPIKPSFKTEWFPVLLMLLSFAIGVYFYQHFPARVATHWDIRGEVNGYSSRGFAAFSVPVLMVALYLLFLVLPYLDPKKEQYDSFAPAYHKFKSLLVVFLLIIYLLLGANGIGYAVDMQLWLPLLVGALFVAIGFLLEKVKMNWFMGIRTPWTLSSEAVWDKTHQASGKVFLIAGLLMAATVFFPANGKIILFIAALGWLILALPVYSYVLYAREKKEKK